MPKLIVLSHCAASLSEALWYWRTVQRRRRDNGEELLISTTDELSALRDCVYALSDQAIEASATPEEK